MTAPSPAECRCTMLRAQTHLEPSEWEQADDCPVHPLATAPSPALPGESEERVRPTVAVVCGPPVKCICPAVAWYCICEASAAREVSP